MKVSKENAARHRESLLKAAAAQVRQVGFDALNVTQLAQSAGLTHGALYSHFGSKQALLSAACACAVTESQVPMEAMTLEELLAMYLSVAHREHPELGCAVAALVSETRNQPPEVQKEFSEGVTKLLKIFEGKISQGSTSEKSHEQAVASVAMVVGAVAISRAVSNTNRPLADEFLKLTEKNLLANKDVG